MHNNSFLTGFLLFILCVSFPLLDSNARPNDRHSSHYQGKTIADPLEKVNRGIFKFNEVIDAILLKPLAKVYSAVVPEKGKKAIDNIISNLTVPVTFTNALLQGNGEKATNEFWRFTLNSTLGLGGIFDFASNAGLYRQSPEDMGQTLGNYGIGDGPYIVWPIWGSSNLRDSVGMVADGFMDPFNYIDAMEFHAIRNGVGGVHRREQFLDIVDDVYDSSLDPYATFRSMYTQRRLSLTNQ